MAKKKLSIDEYRAKRDFEKTPEPAPKRPKAPAADALGGRFVVHRHEARRLHYDLRLEMAGVLKSWAVPKGFSWVPEDKHLAVRTEDHPIEYLVFDGVIPKGEYGAGTMTIWDSGRFELRNDDGQAGLEDGKLEVVLFGGRLRGQWEMVKTSQGENDWLVFKKRDRFARAAGEPLFPFDLSREEPAELSERGRAMRAAESCAPFSDNDWLFELEFAGQRLRVAIRGDDVRFVDAEGAAFGAELPEIARDLRRLKATTALVDGVVVAHDAQERPDRKLLEKRLATKETAELVYYAFDLVHWEDWSLARFPLLERKRALRSIIPELPQVLYVDHVVGRGEELCEVVARGGLAGAIAKRAASAYAEGPSADWRAIPASPSGGRAGGGKTRARKTVTESLGAGNGRRIASRVKITNRNKVYWPKEGITKGELLDWYDRVAEVLLPYLRDRPVHMLRYPDGIEGKSFYHKNVTGRIPDWVETVSLGEKDGEEVRYVVCNDRDTLIHLVNLGSIDLHPWLSRVDDLDTPDWAILDLDPSSTDFAKVVRIATTVGKILRGAGLRPYLKTSGASGLHIHIPLVREYSYDQAKMFCEAVARMTVKEHKDVATVERTVANRESKVYVDFGQNRREQTVVPPWVVRPVPGATVSTPLDWDELDRDLHPSRFDMRTALERLERLGDLFRGTLTDPQGLAAAIEALSER
jgi:bifunctional non-homologous end joining protein LigD